MKVLLSVALSLGLGLGALTGARAEELRILTSFPSEMTSVFEHLWQQHRPDVKLRILNKNTVSAVEEIRRGNARGFDVFWASSPEAFVFLNRDGHFVDGATCGEDGPDPVEAFAISSVGWSRRAGSTALMPESWNDLLRPIYRDQIAMARPARSGTTHLMVEQLLQMRGWEDGWAYLLELAGNLSTLTARSYGVPDGLENARFEIGLMIDFLSTSRGDALQFRYGQPLMPFSARIGVLRDGGNHPMACDFIRLLLSPKGQLALMEPDVSRIPIDPNIRADLRDKIPDEITAGLTLPWLKYNPEVSADRYWAVNALFDLMISDVLVERRTLWRRYGALRGRVAAERLTGVKQLLTQVPISELEAIEMSQRAGLRPSVLPSPNSGERATLELWKAQVAELLQRASAELDQLEGAAQR